MCLIWFKITTQQSPEGKPMQLSYCILSFLKHRNCKKMRCGKNKTSSWNQRNLFERCNCMESSVFLSSCLSRVFNNFNPKLNSQENSYLNTSSHVLKTASTVPILLWLWRMSCLVVFPFSGSFLCEFGIEMFLYITWHGSFNILYTHCTMSVLLLFSWHNKSFECFSLLWEPVYFCIFLAGCGIVNYVVIHHWPSLRWLSEDGGFQFTCTIVTYWVCMLIQPSSIIATAKWAHGNSLGKPLSLCFLAMNYGLRQL